MFVKVNHEHRQVHLALNSAPAPALAAVSVLTSAQCQEPARPWLTRVLMPYYMTIGQHHAMTAFTPNGRSKR